MLQRDISKGLEDVNHEMRDYLSYFNDREGNGQCAQSNADEGTETDDLIGSVQRATAPVDSRRRPKIFVKYDLGIVEVVFAKKYL